MKYIRIMLIAPFMMAMICFQSCDEKDDNSNDRFETISGTINGYDYVDLGLSVKWATCNVGATSPEEYGDYFAWGEVSPKRTYTIENCDTYENATIGSIAGKSKYDAARTNWGSSWRMPTKEETKELLDNCSFTWTSRNGVMGCLVTSKKNGKSIFLPAAGFYYQSQLYAAGEDGHYWSATPHEDITYQSYQLYFYDGKKISLSIIDRHQGQNIRPVSE